MCFKISLICEGDGCYSPASVQPPGTLPGKWFITVAIGKQPYFISMHCFSFELMLLS